MGLPYPSPPPPPPIFPLRLYVWLKDLIEAWRVKWLLCALQVRWKDENLSSLSLIARRGLQTKMGYLCLCLFKLDTWELLQDWLALTSKTFKIPLRLISRKSSHYLSQILQPDWLPYTLFISLKLFKKQSQRKLK